MNQSIKRIVTLIGIGLIAGSSAARADGLDRLFAGWGRFELHNGKTRIVAHGVEIRRYRVCMEEGPGAVPLKVTFDGRETIVDPGDCEVIEARNIKLASAARLESDTTLVGRFNPGGTKKFNTSISVAETTPATTSAIPDVGPVGR